MKNVVCPKRAVPLWLALDEMSLGSLDKGFLLKFSKRRLAVALALSFLALVAVRGSAQSPPPNDDFANAIVLTNNAGTFLGTNTTATAEPDEPAWWLEGS